MFGLIEPDVVRGFVDRIREVERRVGTGVALTPEDARSIRVGIFLRKIAPYLFEGGTMSEPEPQP